MTQIDDTIATYLTALAVEGKRPRTIESYDETLRAFCRAGRELALPDAIEDYTVEHAYAFLGDLQARGASAAYRNRRHREVRAFFSWCQKMGRLDPDRRHVFARVKLAPEERRVKPPFSADEVAHRTPVTPAALRPPARPRGAPPHRRSSPSRGSSRAARRRRRAAAAPHPRPAAS